MGDDFTAGFGSGSGSNGGGDSLATINGVGCVFMAVTVLFSLAVLFRLLANIIGDESNVGDTDGDG